MTKKTLTLLAVSLAFPAFVAMGQSPAPEPDYKIESHVISGGGGTSSAGDIVLSGTIGQPVVGLSTGGNYQLKAGFWSVMLDVVVVPDESFETWMENLDEEDKPPEGQRGPEDIVAGDGMTNLLKYALGLMPMTPSPEAAPAVFMDEGFLSIELDRSRTAAVTFELEGSTDLNGWVDVPFNETITDGDLGDNRERVQLLTGLNQESHPKYFLRLRIRMQ